MTFEIFLAVMLAAALVSVMVLFSRASEGPMYIKRGGRLIRRDPPTPLR